MSDVRNEFGKYFSLIRQYQEEMLDAFLLEDDIDYHFNKVKRRKIEGLMPPLFLYQRYSDDNLYRAWKEDEVCRRDHLTVYGLQLKCITRSINRMLNICET